MKINQTSSYVISALLEELDKHYPNQIPINQSPSIEELRRLQGHQEVIQHIRNLVDVDETNYEE